MGRVQKLWKGLLAGSAGLAALAAANSLIARRAIKPTPDAPGNEITGEARMFDWKHGRISYRTAGADVALPLIFIHGVGAGASSLMWQRNTEALARDFRIYSLDLLGFGLSDKPAAAPYSADLYVELIADFIREVVKDSAHIVASSLGAAFAVRVADEHKELVDSLVLVAPTGADVLRARPGMAGAAFYGLLHSPVLGTSFYNAVASERSIRDYARRQLFFDRRFVTDRFVTEHYALSHQPGAQHPISAFLSGYLNTDVRDAFARLTQPVTLVWGRQDQTNPLEQATELLRLNPHARLEIFDRCRMMPQEEDAEKFNALVRETLRPRSAAA
ncbi:MAG: alpha/beta fold hydrolase [Pyrinomonadaceae bacterium]|nr:alpha/beta fold hydrolase [Pyrinomonadaceae bacterium]